MVKTCRELQNLGVRKNTLCIFILHFVNHYKDVQKNTKTTGLAYKAPPKHGLYSCLGCSKVDIKRNISTPSQQLNI